MVRNRREALQSTAEAGVSSDQVSPIRLVAIHDQSSSCSEVEIPSPPKKKVKTSTIGRYILTNNLIYIIDIYISFYFRDSHTLSNIYFL